MIFQTIMRDNLQPVGIHRMRSGHRGRDDDRAGSHLESTYAEKAAKLRRQEETYDAYARAALRERKSSAKRLTLDKTKSRSAGNMRTTQSAKKADTREAVKKFEEATRRLAEWQRDNKPGKPDYSRTSSKIDTGLNKSAFLQQTDRSPEK